MQQTRKNNVFFISFEVSLILFCFVFVSIWGSGYFYETSVLCCCALPVFIWGILSVLEWKRSKQKIFTLENIFVFFIFVLLSGYFVKVIWYGGYQTLQPIRRLLSGNMHIDTLYHSTVSESFKINGYSSIQINYPTFLKTHFGSHFIISLISSLLKLPSIFVYCYLYPVLFLPFFLFLLQMLLVDVRNYFQKTESLTFFDYLFLFGLCVGFLPNDLHGMLGIYWTATYVSESYFISLIIVMIFVKCLLHIYRFSKISGVTVYYMLIPLSIIIISLLKISVGFLLLGCCCYYVFRREPKKLKTWFMVVYFCLFFSLVYFFPYVATNELSSGSGRISILHYAKNYVYNKSYILIHYAIVLLPSVFLFIYENEHRDISKKMYRYDLQYLLPEMVVIMSIVGNLPGVFLEIGGGSAGYFMLPALFASLYFLWCYDLPNILLSVLSKNMKMLFIVFLFCLFTPYIYNFLVVTKDTVSYTKANPEMKYSELASAGEKLSLAFGRVSENDDVFFQTLNEINYLSKKDRKYWCIFVSDDCSVYKIYTDRDRSDYLVKPYFLLTSYLGIPVMNAIYEENGAYFRGDGTKFPNNKAAYGLSTIKIDAKVNSDNMMERALELGKRHIVYLTGDTYKIINVY